MSSARGRRKRAARKIADYYAWIGARCCAPGDIRVFVEPSAVLPGQAVDYAPNRLSVTSTLLVVGFCCGRPAEMRRLGDGVPVCKAHDRRWTGKP